MSTASDARSSNADRDSKRLPGLSDSRLNDFLPASFHLESIASTVTGTMSTTVSTTASMLFSPLATRAVKGDTAYILSELAPQLMDQRRIQQLVNNNGSTRHTKEGSNQLVSPEDISTSTTIPKPDDILLDSEIPESKAPLSLFQGYKVTFQEIETTNNSKKKSKLHKRKVRGLLADTFGSQDTLSDTTSVDSDHKPLNQLIADRDRVVRENNKIQIQESRTKAEIRNIEDEIAELTARKLNLETNLSKYNERQVELSSQLEELDEKIANFNPEYNYNERRTRTKGKGIAKHNYEHGTCIKVLEGHDDIITCLDFDKPYGTLVTASLDNTLKAWDLNNYRCLGILDGHQDVVNCLQVNGSRLVTGSRDKTIRQWDLSKLISHPESVTNLSELSFASASTNGLSNVGDNCWIASLEGHSGSVTCLHFENSNLVSGSSDKTMKYWDMETGQCILTMDILWAMSSSKAERRQAGFLFDSLIFDGGEFIGALQFRDVGLASGTEDGAIRMWDLRTGQAHRTLLGHSGPITSLQFDNLHVVSGSVDRSIRIWDLRTGSIIDTFSYDHSITSLQFDASKIISCAGSNDIKVYNRTNFQHSSFGEHSQQVQCVKFKDSILSSGGRDKMVKLWAL